MLRPIYLILNYILFWVLWPFLLMSKKTRAGQRQRFGIGLSSVDHAEATPRIWLHGASAGDLLALFPMVEQLRQSYPKAYIVVSAMTNSGATMAQGSLKPFINRFVFCPYDLPGSTRRALNSIRPDMLVLEYAELWPQFIRAAKERGCLLVLTNGRFHPKRQRSYRLLFALAGNMLRQFDALLMREDIEAERVIELGASSDRVQVTGNTKFDALMRTTHHDGREALERALGFSSSDVVLMAGSTHEGEEATLVDIYQRLLKEFPSLKLVLAPRYLERVPEVENVVRVAGLRCALRSKGNAEHHEVVILDTMGELAKAYRLATLVFIGGSFVSRGGQNILEPAAHGKPVLFGPNMDNFHDSVQVLLGRGALQAHSREQLYTLLNDLLSKPERITALGTMAKLSVEQVSGASRRNVEVMKRLLASRSLG